MLAGKNAKNEARELGEKAFKMVTVQYLLLGAAIVQILVFFISKREGLFPGEEAIRSIAGTGAEIIAGLYGLTLAGYTFFLSRIDALTASDATLDYVVASVKNRFKYLIWFITLNVLMTLLVSMFLMYCPAPENVDHVFYYRLFCNEFVVFLGSSVAMILYYSILVIDPNCLEKEARKLKKKISRSLGPEGNAAEFIALYDRIENRCNRLIPASVLHQLQENKGKRFEYTLALLQEQKLLSVALLRDITRIHRYYECAVNTMPLSVSMEMVQLARHVVNYLEEALPERK